MCTFASARASMISVSEGESHQLAPLLFMIEITTNAC